MQSVDTLSPSSPDSLPEGVRQIPLNPRADHRGWLGELFRDDWPGLPELRQWNVVSGRPGSMRGMHVHLQHHDFIIVLSGEMLLGLCDIREGKAGRSALLALNGENPAAVLVPPGVVHGFATSSGYTLVYGMSHTWNPDDDICCRWDDPGVGIDWPGIENPALSERDARAGTLAELAVAWNAASIK